MVAPVSGTRSQQDHARHVALLGFVIGLALIVLLAVLGIGNAREASDAVARVESSHTAIEAIEAISARLGEAKSARRAYGLTGEATYRQIYKQAVAALSEGMLLIARLTADHPTLHGALVELAPVVTQRLARLEDQNLAREATGKEVLPTDTIAVENGKLDDTIRRLTTTMIAEERSLLETREQASRDRLGRGEIVGGIGAASACILLLLAFGLLSREVLQRRRAEAATRKALVATEALNSELEAFSYSVSHDLRAPLRAIDGFSQALLEDNAAQLDEGGKHHLDRVRSASQRMAQLIDDLLGLSRVTRSPLRSEGLELSELAEAALVDLREANRDRQVEVAIEGGLTAHGDPRLLRIVHRQASARAHRGRRAHREGRVRVLRSRRRHRLRSAVRREAVRSVPAAPRRPRVRGDRHRPGDGAAHRAPPRRSDLGEQRARARRHLQLHPGLPRIGRDECQIALPKRSSCSSRTTPMTQISRCARCASTD